MHMFANTTARIVETMNVLCEKKEEVLNGTIVIGAHLDSGKEI